MRLGCPRGMTITHATFASYGRAGAGAPREASCGACQLHGIPAPPSSAAVADVVDALCTGQQTCSVFVSDQIFPGMADRRCPPGVPAPCGRGPGALYLTASVACEAGAQFAVDTNFGGWSRGSWPAARALASREQDRVRHFLESVPPFPVAEHRGRGIVIVAGGKYLNDAMVTIAAIRSYNCTLPIQVWHLGAQEMPASALPFLAAHDVETRDVLDYVEEVLPIESNVGFRPFQLKPLALMHTDLQHVLLLDADSVPTRDPSYLFEGEQYARTGSLFWPGTSRLEDARV